MFSCLQILEAFLWFVLITLLNVTLIILTLSVSRLLNLLLRLVFFSDKLVLTSVTPASSAPVLQTPKATSSTLYFDSLTVNAGNGGFLHCIQMDTSVNAANQVVSVGADIAFDADPKFFA